MQSRELATLSLACDLPGGRPSLSPATTDRRPQNTSQPVILVGTGMGTGTHNACGTEIRTSGAADNIILISSGSAGLRDLCVTSSVAAGSRTGAGIKITAGPLVLISRVTSNGHEYGIWNQAGGNEFEHVFAVSNSADGFFFDGSVGVGTLNEIGIYYCQANSNTSHGFAFIAGTNASAGVFAVRPTAASNGGAGFYISGLVNDINITIPELSSNTTNQLDATAGTGGNLIVVGGLIEVVSGGGEAVVTGTTQSYVSLTGNAISAPSGVTIIIGGPNSTLTGNIIVGAGTAAIISYGAGANTMTISGNTIEGDSNGSEVGIAVTSGQSRCMIGTNVFHNVTTQITDGTSACQYGAITGTAPTYP